MSQSSASVVSDIIAQLTMIFKMQKAYVSSENAFEDILTWEQMNEDWDCWNAELDITLQRVKLQDSDRLSIQLLIDDHHKLCDYVQAELVKISQQINMLQNTKKAREVYEHSEDTSIFYDEKK